MTGSWPLWRQSQVRFVVDVQLEPIYQCKFYRPWMDRSAEQEELRRDFWGSEKQEAQPWPSMGSPWQHEDHCREKLATSRKSK